MSSADATQRAHRQRASKELTASVRAILINSNIPLPVRVVSPLFAPAVTYVEATPGIEDCGDDVWLVEASSDLAPLHKVQRKGRKWTCSCPKWAKQRGIDCQHITRVKTFVDASHDGHPYQHARRSALPRIIYNENAASESTRYGRARQSIPERVPFLLAALCRLIDDPLVNQKVPKRGRPSAPLGARAYAIVMKAFYGLSYARLLHVLREDQFATKLGLVGKLSVNSLCNWAADAALTSALRSIMQRCAATGRKMDSTLVIDATGRSTTLSGDYLEYTYGNKPKARRHATFLKEHFIRGRRSGLVYGVNFTLSSGTGSSDAVHLRVLMEQVADIAPNVRMLIGDKAYGAIGNYLWCEQMGITLVTRAKKHETRKGKHWPVSARELASLEKSDPRFNRLYNQRSVAECTPSGSKRRNRSSRLRRRKTDPVIDILVPAGKDEDALTTLAQDQLRSITQRQNDAVGVARLNEGYAMHIVDNLCTLVRLEELYESDVSFVSGRFAFEPIATIWMDVTSLQSGCIEDDAVVPLERTLELRANSLSHLHRSTVSHSGATLGS